MRRLFIIRKDLHLSGGKLAAMVGHCCEAYWTRLLKKCSVDNVVEVLEDKHQFRFKVDINQDIWKEYCLGIFTKTICEAPNKNQLMKVLEIIRELREDNVCNLVLGEDYDFINDKCLTELKPENEDGTTTVGIWFKPLPDDIAHRISKKYKLYKDSSKVKILTIFNIVDNVIKHKVVSDNYMDILENEFFPEFEIECSSEVLNKIRIALQNGYPYWINNNSYVIFLKDVEI